MCHLTCRRNANFFQREFPVFSNRMYWKLSAGHKREAVRWMWERLVGSHTWKLCPWSLASKKWGALEAPWQMTPIRAAFVFSKACDIAGEDAFSVASQHSIGLIDIKWGTFMRRRTSYVTWYVGEMPPSSRENSQFCRTECFEIRMPTCSSENSQLVQTECLESSRQNTRGKLQGVCGKDYLENKLKAVPLEPCKQEVRSTWGTLTDDSYSSSFYLLQSMWHCRRRWVCVASQHSSALFDQKTVHDKNSNGDIGGFPKWNWKNSKQSLSISEHCKKTTDHTKWPSLIFLNLSRG